DILLDKNNFISPVTEMLLYASSRAQLMEEKILPAIEEGKIVLLDRFVDSSYVYQGYARGLGIEKVKIINEIATMGILPDVTIYIDITPEEAMKRRGEREADRLERESWDFHKKVREGYIKLIKEFPQRFVFIDGMQELMKVHQDILDVVKKYL
ncbi:dTMP kinase, partial [Thermoanaerobacter sp. A7A]|uniref:dTMP kinase n=1 Tax=Thermoanaerobacter sp. A7A TaxID=1350366 RepID=UPI0004A4280C